MAGITEPLGIVIAAAGAGLVYAAVTGQNPVAELRAALSTGQLDGRPPARPFGQQFIDPLTRVVREAAGRAGVEPPPGSDADGTSWPDDPANLVSIGQGGHRLAAPAARAFQAWQAAYGRTIPVTDSYRSVAQQQRDYERDPSRFGRPGNSAHGEGRAVDVNLPALGLNPRGEPSEWLADAGYRALVEAASATGWCNYQVRARSANGRTREPWHFSYGVCK